MRGGAPDVRHPGDVRKRDAGGIAQVRPGLQLRAIIVGTAVIFAWVVEGKETDLLHGSTGRFGSSQLRKQPTISCERNILHGF